MTTSRPQYSPDAVLSWAVSTFGDLACSDRERALRFLEEAIELGQAMGLTFDDLHRTGVRVYDREPGRIQDEIAQTRMTLDALCSLLGVDSELLAEVEFSRVQRFDKEHWQERHNAKAELGIAEPIAGEDSKQ